MATTPITKYRPYLSVEEMDAIIALIDNEETFPSGTTDAMKTARDALMKTRTLASLGLQKEAYKTNPRPTLSDRLGFSVSSEQETPANQAAITPDFNSLMEELSAIAAPNQPEQTNVND